MNPGSFIPILIFSIPIVAIVGHYASEIIKTRYKASQSSASEAESAQLQKLTQTAESMADRIATLESILDAEVPDWRDDHDRH